jgi:DNA helicase-2/ATP-dependent DNA helicase PcrA
VLQYADEASEATEVVGEIETLVNSGVEPRKIAVLFRTNEQPRAFEGELRRAKLPYTLVGGMSFYDRKEVRDILSYLKVVAQPSDEVSMLRIINTPARGLGKAAVEALVKRATTDGVPLWDILPQARSVTDLSQPALDGAFGLVSLVRGFQKKFETEPLVDVVRELIGEIDYKAEIDRNYKEQTDRDARWNTIEELVNAVGIYAERKKKKATLVGFLEEVMLNAREEAEDDKDPNGRNAITLMTLHAAKGLEFPHVYMVGMEEGLLPHRRSAAADGAAIDEERRLCYVGVTRAQDRLTLTMALSRFKWGRSKPTIPSRFLFELSGKADNPQALEALEQARKEFRPEFRGPRFTKGKGGGKGKGLEKGTAKPGKRPSSSSRGNSSRPRGKS